MDGKIKTWTLRFPAKENPNMEKALFDWPIVLQYDIKPKYQLISRKFSGVKSFHPTVRLTNQKPRTFCIRSTNQSNRSISVRLLLLCCSRVFISRSYENCSNVDLHTAMPFTSQSMGKNSLVWSVFVQSIQDFTDSHHPLSQVIAAFKLLSSILTSSLIVLYY